MTDAHELLILYLEDELDEDERREVETRLGADAQFAAELAELRRSLELVNGSVPLEPEAEYWRSFYGRLHPRLQRTSLWSRIAGPFRSNAGLQYAGLAAGLAAVLVVVSLFLAQVYFRTEPIPAVTETTVVIKRTQGVLEHIVDAHLDRSLILLQDVENVDTDQDDLPQLLAYSRERSEQLLSDNRTFRLAAERRNDEKLVQLLDDLEVVLIEIANLDPDVAQYALPTVKRYIRSKDLLIKIEITRLNEDDPQSTDATSPEREVI